MSEKQEPIARVTGVYGGRFIVEPLNPAMVLPTNMALYAEPQPKAEKQEPAIDNQDLTIAYMSGFYDGKKKPKREWVGLTGEMLITAAQSCLSPHQYDHFESLLESDPDAHNRLARAIEAKLKQKNGYAEEKNT